MSIRRCLLAALALTSLLAPAAWAAYPKRGTYVDTKLQVYLVTTKNAKALNRVQFPCQFKADDGSTVSSGGGTIAKKVPISSSGNVSFSTRATIIEGSDNRKVRNLKLTVRFSGGKAKGTLTIEDSPCLPVTFTAKYYGDRQG